MAAGGPGDHWRTDLLNLDRPAFGEPSDTLIREIYQLGGHKLLDDEATLGQLLWDLWPQWGSVDYAKLAQLADRLSWVRDDLRQQAIDNGWDVD